VQHAQVKCLVQVNGVTVPQEAIDPDRAADQAMEARHRSLADLRVDIFDPVALGWVGGNDTARGGLDGLGGADVVGVRMGQHERANLGWLTADRVKMVEDHLLGPSHATVDQADVPAADEIDVDEAVQRDAGGGRYLKRDLQSVNVLCHLHGNPRTSVGGCARSTLRQRDDAWPW
jgi:hypothetical protein